MNLDSMTEAQIGELAQAARVDLGPGYGDGPPAVLHACQNVPTAVVACLRARADKGLAKYGRLLPVGWPWAACGALQEACDLLVYLSADEDAPPFERMLAASLVTSIATRVADQIQEGAL